MMKIHDIDDLERLKEKKIEHTKVEVCPKCGQILTKIKEFGNEYFVCLNNKCEFWGVLRWKS